MVPSSPLAALPGPLLPPGMHLNLPLEPSLQPTPTPQLWGAKLSIFCRENSIFVEDAGAQVGPCLLYKLYRLWPPLCVCVCVRPAMARRSPGHVRALCASLPTPALPSGNDRSLLPPEPWPLVSSLFCYLLAASLHLICPQAMSREPLTSASYTLRGHPASPFAQAPLGCLPPCPLRRAGKLRGEGDKRNLTWAPPPRSPCASPTTSWKRRGPQEGVSPTSLLSSTHCWNGLRG